MGAQKRDPNSFWDSRKTSWRKGASSQGLGIRRIGMIRVKEDKSICFLVSVCLETQGQWECVIQRLEHQVACYEVWALSPTQWGATEGFWTGGALGRFAFHRDLSGSWVGVQWGGLWNPRSYNEGVVCSSGDVVWGRERCERH